MRGALVLFLMICVGVVPVLPRSVSDAPGQSAKELKKQAALREKIERMGSGARIQVAMRGTSVPVTYEGVIDEINAESFKLKTKDQILPIQYGQIEKLTLKERGYKTQRQPDPVRVRQVVADMGVGENAKVTLVSNERFNGTIQSIEKESFVVVSNGKPVPVKYSEVTEIKKKKFPAWGKVAIAGGVVAGLLAALVYSACGSAGCH